MSSQVPFTPLTPEALAKLTEAERAAFKGAVESVGMFDLKPGFAEIVTLIEIIGRLISEEPTRPRIVCLCGSTRFGEAFAAANLERTLAGEIVLSIGCSMRDDEVFARREAFELAQIKTDLDLLHKRKIDVADYVLIVSDDSGYFGQSTTGEIRYAIEHGKPVEFANPASAQRARDAGLLP